MPSGEGQPLQHRHDDAQLKDRSIVGHALRSSARQRAAGASVTVPAMKKVIVIIVVLALAAFAVKKLQDAA